MNLAERLIVALDVDSLAEAKKLVESLSPLGVTFKVGLQLFCREGPAAVAAVRRLGGEVFLDLKLHDIPNTAAQASRALAGLGVRMFNLHAAGGRAMLAEAAREARREAARVGVAPPLLLGVTLLTSLGQRELNEELGVTGGVEEQAIRLAFLCLQAGLDGVVASPREVPAIKAACGKGFLAVTPGVRPAGAEAGDQQRVLTPGEAIRAGADYLVVGRPITAAPDPHAMARKILAEMKEAAGC